MMKKLVLILLTSIAVGCQSEKDSLVTISTEYGDIVLVLHDQTPGHKSNFIKLASEGFYDSTTFHRVKYNFMIQGGDPNSKDDNPYNDGKGGPGYTIPAEFNSNLKHVYGALAAARWEDNVNPDKESSGSQFYIVNNPQGALFLDDAYTVFGQTIDGFEVIQQISKQAVVAKSRPTNDIPMTITIEELPKEEIAKKYDYKFNVK